ncbi:unnamed protein product [Colias eurytheme]|nr:unnamed protein product [Colias eurytheme]
MTHNTSIFPASAIVFPYRHVLRRFQFSPKIFHVQKNSGIGFLLNRWNEAKGPWEIWRNITTDVYDGYVNWPSIHKANKRFRIVVHPKEGPSKALPS